MIVEWIFMRQDMNMDKVFMIGLRENSMDLMLLERSGQMEVA